MLKNPNGIPCLPFFCFVFVCLLLPLSPVAAADGSVEDPRKGLWKTARGRIEEILACQGRTPLDIESPKWYEVPYSTAGRMPLIDTCLREPLVMPEVIDWADGQVKSASGSLSALFSLAYRLSAQTMASPGITPASAETPAWVDTFRIALEESGVPTEYSGPAAGMLGRMAAAADARDIAFSSLTDEERARAADLLPGYFVRKSPGGESIRGYTAEIDDCVELIGILSGADLAPLLHAAASLAEEADAFRRAVESAPSLEPSELGTGILFDEITPIGRVVVAGAGDDIHSGEAAFMLDLGGDDLYLGRPASTSMGGSGVAFHADLDGDDVYRSDGFAQGSAVAGVALFLDLAGDDRYISGHYSQGAALAGCSFFFEGGGDDTYDADLGVQCFSIFGYSIFSERGGRDSYRCAANGQGSASTLGVSILAEAGGDDIYRAGGKYGFYYDWDSSCAQGAASGMRPWPPSGKITVYGGIGFLSDAGGNDLYHAYNIGQGGSYVFALGMLADSGGNDTYYAERYCRGVGVHLAAAVALDRDGNDIRTGFYGNDGYSLDRSSGVFVDLAGDDSYRTSGGIGYGHKPKGTGIFFDASGDDNYAGWENNYGRADWPFGDEAFSTGFFLDFGGEDVYRGRKYRNDAVWSEGDYGYGEDSAAPPPPPENSGWWAPTPPPDRTLEGFEDEEFGKLLRTLAAPSPLERLAARKLLADDPGMLAKGFCSAAAFPEPGVRRNLIDLVQAMIVADMLDTSLCSALSPLLDREDYDMRLLGLMAVERTGRADQKTAGKIAELALSDPSWEVRSMACLALGGCRADDALAPLLTGLEDRDWRVRRRAAIALAGLEAPDSFAALARILRRDRSHQVRGQAAGALGAVGDEDAVPLLKRALQDRSKFVRCRAARALLAGFDDKAGLYALIDLLDWKNRPMRDQLVTGFLTDYTGISLPADRKTWKEWWSTASKSFDTASHSATYETLKDARESKSRGFEEEAIERYRSILAAVPGHAGASKELSDLLNGIAWNLAVAGKDLTRALSLARESVDCRKNPMNLDTLAVLYYLTGDDENADKTIAEAIDSATGHEKKLFEHRRQEFSTGNLVLN